ncbi:hypothetical protein [Dysgonomonas sp. BGC7]|uniref:hypothetical protein n=1 Tax=Dysgonomonas sp. BGC7 TaxID=1658008 RepID=UPI000681E504|nr:hypothetical protein [Dysgonomonas sp. BGC7]MBD8390010.1 hypothetical protein [Dysgonomonas sp. BGC7]
MKKLLISIILISLTCSLFAQKSSKTDLAIPYDSTVNFLGKNATGYTGQELFLMGLDKPSQAYGYSGFILKYKKDDGLLNDEKNIYKSNDNYNSRYEDLAHKYFHVLEVIKHPKGKQGEVSTNTDFYLKLQELTSGDIVYYKYDVNAEYTFPFIVRGYFEKQRQLFTGNVYVLSDSELKMSRNIVTGKAITPITGQKWKCTDVNIDNSTNELSLILQNPGGVKISVPFSILKAEGIKTIYTESEADSYTKQFNQNNFRRILQNKIRVGMTKEMTRLAWGEPTDITTKGATELWSYPAGNLTFRGDKIISTK